MTFGGPILKRKQPTRNRRIELNSSQLRDIIVAHLYAVSVLDNNEEVIDIHLPEMFKHSFPMELKIRKNSLK